MVIQYVGSPVCPVPAAHGNSLTNRPYIRTNPSVLAKIKEVVEVTAGHAAPAKMYKEAIRGADTDDPRACPRNINPFPVPGALLLPDAIKRTHSGMRRL